jgi:hypothetical protein
METFEYFAHTTGGHLAPVIQSDSIVSRMPARWTNDLATDAGRLIKLFLEVGPILTPEYIDIPTINFGDRQSEGFPVLQNRFCMTVVRNETDIARHMSIFGPITFCLRPSQAFMLGPVSVSYIPAVNEDERLGLDTSLGIVHRLRELSSFLQDIELLGFSQDDEVLRLIEEQRPECFPIGQVRQKVLEILSILRMDHSRLLQLDRTIHAVAQGFYPSGATSQVRNKYFKFFWEREWRVIAGVALGRDRATIPLTDELRASLMDINYSYFGSPIDRFDLGCPLSSRVVDDCRRFSPSFIDHFLTAIETVFIDRDLLDCDSPVLQDAIQVLKSLHIRIVPISAS